MMECRHTLRCSIAANVHCLHAVLLVTTYACSLCHLGYWHPCGRRLGSHDSAGGGGGSGGGAPASGGWGGGGVVHARSGSPTGAPGAGHHGHGHGYGYGLPDSALPPERHSTGGTAVERHSGGGLLQPLKHLWGGECACAGPFLAPTVVGHGA